MATKLRPTAAVVDDLIAAFEDDDQRGDARTLVRMMKRATGEAPKLWTDGSIGFGEVARGARVAPALAFVPYPRSVSIHVAAGFASAGPLLARLGKHTLDGAELRVGRLSEIDLFVLDDILHAAFEESRALAAEKPARTRARKAVRRRPGA